ncbi:MAG TPA: hypothetical protein VFH83_14520 [Spirochaetia bacterium]|nr:hypothetical protein [Spirochaetia bacterium]
MASKPVRLPEDDLETLLQAYALARRDVVMFLGGAPFSPLSEKSKALILCALRLAEYLTEAT